MVLSHRGQSQRSGAEPYFSASRRASWASSVMLLGSPVPVGGLMSCRMRRAQLARHSASWVTMATAPTHHFADGLLGLVQLLPGAVDQALGVADPVPGAVGLGARVLHRVADILQAVPLRGQRVVDGAQAAQQASVQVCRVTTRLFRSGPRGGSGYGRVRDRYLCWSAPPPAAP